MWFSSFEKIVCIKKLMITIPAFLFPNKYDSNDMNHYVADCKIATFRHVFILGLDFLAATIYKRKTVENFLLWYVVSTALKSLYQVKLLWLPGWKKLKIKVPFFPPFNMQLCI